MLEARSVVKGGRRGFSRLLLFNIPQGLCVHHVSYSATQPFLFKAILEASVTSQPLHGSHRRQAGKQGRGQLAGKGSTVSVCEQRGEPELPAKTSETWRQCSNGSTATVPCPVLAEGNASCCHLLPEIAVLPSRDKAPGSRGTGRRDGTVVVAAQGDWLPAWLFVGGR